MKLHAHLDPLGKSFLSRTRGHFRNSNGVSPARPDRPDRVPTPGPRGPFSLAQPVEQQLVQPFRRVKRYPVARAGNFLVTPRPLNECRRFLHALAVEVMVAV